MSSRSKITQPIKGWPAFLVDLGFFSCRGRVIAGSLGKTFILIAVTIELMEAKLLLIPWLVRVSHGSIPVLRITINPSRPILEKHLSDDRATSAGESRLAGECP